MKYECNYCIYNREFLCILKETYINYMGMCEECIVVSVPEKVLKALKDKQFKENEEWRGRKRRVFSASV